MGKVLVDVVVVEVVVVVFSAIWLLCHSGRFIFSSISLV